MIRLTERAAWILTGFLLSLVLWAVLLFGSWLAMEAFADHRVPGTPASAVLGNPRPVWIDPRLDSAPWQLAMRDWNLLGGPEFLQVTDPNAAPVWIVPTAGRTWVLMPNGYGESVVYVGPDVRDWHKHELGHTWGKGDHVPEGMDTTGYRGWAYCSGPGARRYLGIMSYCGDHLTFTEDDALAHGWY